MTVDKQSPWFLVLLAAAGIVVFGLVLTIQPRNTFERMILGQNDFMQLYAGARLSGTPELYSPGANLRVQKEIAGIQADSIVHSRPPFYSFFLQPLARLPYRTAYYTFQAISLLAFLAFRSMFLPGCRELAAFATISIPLFATFENGQDSTLVLLFAGLSIFLARRNLDFWSGFALSFCAIKFHLFPLVPVILLIHRRWPILYGALTGGAILLTVSFASAGIDWPLAYLEAIKNSSLHPHPEMMPNLHAFSAVLPGPAGVGVEIALGAAVFLSVIYLARKVADYELAFAFALVGGILISFHSYVQDCLLLLLPLAIFLKKPVSTLARGLMELAASPAPYFFVFVGAPFSLAMPALLLAILGAALAWTRQYPTAAAQNS